MAVNLPNSVTTNNNGLPTPNFLDPVSPPFALNHARIMYDNTLKTGVAISSNGNNPEYALIPNTYQAWSFVGSQNIEITTSSNQSFDTVCIGAHNLSGTTVSVEYSALGGGPSSSFSQAKTPVTNDAIMFHLPSAVEANSIRVTITGVAGANYKIGWIIGGIALQMARPFFSGHNPMSQNKQHRYYDAWTETGQMVGRSKRSVQLVGDFSWTNLPDAWYREYMPPFIESATRFPYVIAWNLLEYPDDVAMAFTDEDINSDYSGTRNLRSLSFSARGIA